MNSIDRSWVEKHIDENGIVIIPDGVERIEAQAFAINERVKKVIMPDTVIEIGNKAFCLCKNLQEVQLSKNLQLIEDSAFSRCSSLTSIDLPDSLQTMGTCVFRKCSELKSLNLGNGITSIEALAFEGCGLETISGGENINELWAKAFAQTKMESYEIPHNVKSVLAGAMGENPHLRSITLNENLEFLSKRAFDKCENLEEVNVNGTKRINYSAFLGKSSIRKITVDGQEISLADNEKLFSLQKTGEKVAIVVQDEQGKFLTKAVNLEKGTINIVPTNMYLTNEGNPCYAINSLANISLEGLQQLKQRGITQLYLYGGENEIMPSEHEKGYEFNLYGIDDLLQIKTKVEQIKKRIQVPSKDDKHREKKIYGQIVRILSETIEYDFYETGTSKEKYEKLTRKKL